MLKVTLQFSNTVSRLAGALCNPILAFKTVLSPAVTFPNFMHVKKIKKKGGGGGDGINHYSCYNILNAMYIKNREL